MTKQEQKVHEHANVISLINAMIDGSIDPDFIRAAGFQTIQDADRADAASVLMGPNWDPWKTEALKFKGKALIALADYISYRIEAQKATDRSKRTEEKQKELAAKFGL